MIKIVYQPYWDFDKLYNMVIKAEKAFIFEVSQEEEQQQQQQSYY